MKWHEIHDNQIVLYRYLVYEKKFDGEQLLQVTIRPWKWQTEFNEARRWAATRDAVLAITEELPKAIDGGWRKCVACGDPYDSDHIRHSREQTGLTMQPTEAMYCLECANEKFHNVISTRPARLFSAGGGCPLEPNDSDSSPWQDNAIRDMER